MELKINKSLIVLVMLLTAGIGSAVVVNIDGSGLTPLEWFQSNKTIWDAKPTNATVNPQNMNASNLTSGVAPDSTLPLSALNVSQAHVKVGAFTRDLTLATGTQSITGVGFKPSAVSFIYLVNGDKRVGSGYDDNTSRSFIAYSTTEANWYNNDNDAIDFMTQIGGVTEYAGRITSMDSDGFTISWVKYGSPTGIGVIKYMAFK